MTDQITMSRSGIRDLIRLSRQQHHHHRAIWDFTRDVGVYESHWFDRGFLALFRGDYDAATDDVFAGTSEASSGTYRLAERIADAREDLEHADVGVDRRMSRLREVQEAVKVPELVRHYGGFTNLGGAETPGRHRAPKHEGSTTRTIDAAGSLLSIGHHTQQVVAGVTSDDELEDFLDEHAAIGGAGNDDD